MCLSNFPRKEIEAVHPEKWPKRTLEKPRSSSFSSPLLSSPLLSSPLLSFPRLCSSPLLCEKKGKTEEAKQGAQIGCASENCLMHTRFHPLAGRGGLERPKLLNPSRTPKQSKHVGSGAALTLDHKVCLRKRYSWQACSADADASDH